MAAGKSAKGSFLALVVLGLVVIQVGFGGYGIVLKKFAKDAGTDPLVFSICRDGFCAPLLMIAAALIEGLHKPSLSRDLPFFALLGLTGMFGNQFLYIEGLYYTTPNIASIMQPCIPVFTALLAFMTCMEPLPGRNRQYQWLKIFGILLAVGGAILMVLSRPAVTKTTIVDSIFHSKTCAGSAVNHSYASSTCFPGTPSDDHFPDWHVSDAAAAAAAVKFECTLGDDTISMYSCTDSKCKTCTEHTFSTTKCYPQGTNTTSQYACVKTKESSSFVGVLLLVGNCTAMAIYVLLQKKFVFNPADSGRAEPNSLAAWSQFPIGMTAYSYFFGALCMLIASGIRYAKDHDSSKFEIPKESYGGLAYAVLVSSALCYGLITWCNKYVSATVVTAFWPLQVFVTIILSYFVFNDKLTGGEYGGMALIICGMFSVVYANHWEMQSKQRGLTPLDYMSDSDPLLINQK
eukprot:m.7520 g.7520  ORF g.7520 m.7520 type:complete len:461 (+) comp2966_c0_seq1:107-1489(+)